MKKLIAILFTSISFLIFIAPASGQKVYDKLGKDVCKCINKKANEMDGEKLMGHCIQQEMVGYLDKLMKVEKVKAVTDLDSQKAGYKIATYLLKECPYFRENIVPELAKKNAKREQITTTGCKEFYTGNFYYLIENEESSGFDSAFVEIKENSYVEKRDKGKSVTKLEINWTGECQFELKLISSTDELTNSFNDPGDIKKYKVIEIAENQITLEKPLEGSFNYVDLFKM